MSSNRLIKDALDSPLDTKPTESKSTPSALELHMASFANAEGYVDEDSIYKACHEKMHLSEADSKRIAHTTLLGAYLFGVPGVKYSCGVKGKFHPKDAVPLLTHPHDSGLYDRHTGEFNEKLFQILVDKYAITDDDGTKIISKDKLQEFSSKATNQDGRWNDKWFPAKQLGKIANGGEINVFFERATSRYKPNEAKEMIGYVTIDDLKQWYMNTQTVLEKMQQNQLPGPAPLRRK